MPATTIPRTVAPIIAGELRRLAQVIQEADPQWRGNDCIDTRGGRIDPQDRAGELIIQAVECGLLRQVPNLYQLVMWAKGDDLHPLAWPFAEGDASADSYGLPYKRCPRNVFNTLIGERQQFMTVFPPEVERENEYYEHHPGRRQATRQDQSAMTPHERDLREQVRRASEQDCKKPVIWPLPPHGLLAEFLPSMFPPADDRPWYDTDATIVALHERNDRYARACLALATLIEQEQPTAHPQLRDLAKQRAGDATGTPIHSADFTFVNWYDTEYTFALGVQSSAVKALWNEWEKTGLGLHQDTIRNAIDAERDSFRMDTAFRNHPAFGTMIRRCGDGKYKLAPPTTQLAILKTKAKKSAGITSKSRRKRA